MPITTTMISHANAATGTPACRPLSGPHASSSPARLRLLTNPRPSTSQSPWTGPGSTRETLQQPVKPEATASDNARATGCDKEPCSGRRRRGAFPVPQPCRARAFGPSTSCNFGIRSGIPDAKIKRSRRAGTRPVRSKSTPGKPVARSVVGCVPAGSNGLSRCCGPIGELQRGGFR
jgi:hypothetical protein